MNTEQIDFWKGDFGQEYTERNTFSDIELDEIYKKQYGYTRTEMDQLFIGDLSLQKVLEVGCNVGNILLHLQSIGVTNLYGIELQQYAVERAKARTTGINIVQGSAFDLPFKDAYFEMVFTSGVLIHISPDDINKAIDEMVRVTNRFIWGFEYYDTDYIEIPYHGSNNKMWKTDFAKLITTRHPNFRLVKEKKFPYVNQPHLVDQMYLLEKV